ncbi:hypothetical protein [Natronococcus wangiae]|uniref:hypothetical protein n=1 Tax=Natronococcus wangiae TaxID=3068275 RepID=UPI00273F03B1|nr:hypothetical protein [Natronococcus sp. AD5]
MTRSVRTRRTTLKVVGASAAIAVVAGCLSAGEGDGDEGNDGNDGIGTAHQMSGTKWFDGEPRFNRDSSIARSLRDPGG